MILNNSIAIYGLVYLLGYILLFCLLKFNLKYNLLNSLYIATYCAIATIVGARLCYVIFYEFSYYKDNLFEIIEFYKGGMSFFGGLFTLILVVPLLVPKNYLKIYDLLSICAIITLPLGRLCNFYNNEVFGTPSTLPFAVIFSGIDEIPRHPSQLYEAIAEGPIIALLIFITRKIIKNHFKGQIACLFVVFYCILRFFIEFTREADASLGYFFEILSLGQIFCILFLVIAILMYVKLKANCK